LGQFKEATVRWVVPKVNDFNNLSESSIIVSMTREDGNGEDPFAYTRTRYLLAGFI